MKQYSIYYGCGIATFWTPYEDVEDRFMTLAGTCFGIRKSIMCFEILGYVDDPTQKYERLDFNGDSYIWREDGARRMIKPEWAADEDWDYSYCEECAYKEDKE